MRYPHNHPDNCWGADDLLYCNTCECEYAPDDVCKCEEEENGN
jgi:hypothetical protein